MEDLVRGIPGVLDKRVHSARIAGKFWATILLSSEAEARVAIDSLTTRFVGATPIRAHIWDSQGPIDSQGRTSSVTIDFTPSDASARIKRTDADEVIQLMLTLSTAVPQAMCWMSYPDRGLHFFKLLYGSVETVTQLVVAHGGKGQRISSGGIKMRTTCDPPEERWDYGIFHTGDKGVTGSGQQKKR